MELNRADIWSQIQTGDSIQAKATIAVPNDEGKLRLSVTAGKTYPVTVYSETAGPMVRITGDTGIPHEITGDYLDNFRWIPRKLSGSK